jgi:hypothetical protein
MRVLLVIIIRGPLRGVVKGAEPSSAEATCKRLKPISLKPAAKLRHSPSYNLESLSGPVRGDYIVDHESSSLSCV